MRAPGTVGGDCGARAQRAARAPRPHARTSSPLRCVNALLFSRAASPGAFGACRSAPRLVFRQSQSNAPPTELASGQPLALPALLLSRLDALPPDHNRLVLRGATCRAPSLACRRRDIGRVAVAIVLAAVCTPAVRGGDLIESLPNELIEGDSVRARSYEGAQLWRGVRIDCLSSPQK